MTVKPCCASGTEWPPTTSPCAALVVFVCQVRVLVLTTVCVCIHVHVFLAHDPLFQGSIGGVATLIARLLRPVLSGHSHPPPDGI